MIPATGPTAPPAHSRQSSPDSGGRPKNVLSGNAAETANNTINSGIAPPSFQKYAPQDNWNDPPSLLATRAKPPLGGSARQLDAVGEQPIPHAFNNASTNISQFSAFHHQPTAALPYGGMPASIHHSASYPNLIPSEDAGGFAPLVFGAQNAVPPPPVAFQTMPTSGETTLNKLKATIANSFRSYADGKPAAPPTQPISSENSVPSPLPPQTQQNQNSHAADTVDSGNNSTHSSTIFSAIESLNTLQAIWYYQTLQSAVDEIKPAWVPFTPPENRKLEIGYHMWLAARGKQQQQDHYGNAAEQKHGENLRFSMQQRVTDRITGEDNIKMASLAAAHNSDHHLCSVFGGRHDVDFEQMQLVCVFWDEPPRLVLRATWFYKGATETSFLPYDQAVCLRFEEDYQRTWRLGTWHNRIDIGNGEALVIHSPNAISHFVQPEQSAVWVTVPDALLRPRAVRRSAEGVHIDYPASSAGHTTAVSAASTTTAGGFSTFPPAAELSAATSSTAAQYYDSSYDVDHLVFVVHGIGSVCDLKMRNVIECVGNLRQISRGLLLEHWRDYLEQNQIHRVEFLPIEWHSKLHGETTGVDERLKTITLPSIPKLRNFTNETLLDILFYTSPTYCQTIAETVALEINRLYALYRRRNPRFCGKVSIIGHSLGSLIVFDLLANQQRPPPMPVAADGVASEKNADLATTSISPSVPDIRVPSPANNNDENLDLINKDADNSTTCTLEELISRSGVLLPTSDGTFSETAMTVDKYAEKLRTEAGVRTVEDIMLLTENDFDKLNIPLVQRRRLILAASSVLPGGRIAQLRRHHWLEQQHQLRTVRNRHEHRSSSLAVRGSSLLREKSYPQENSIESYQLDPEGAWRNKQASELSLYSNGSSASQSAGAGVASSISEPNLSTILKQMSTLAVNYTVSTDANNGGVGQPSVYYPKLSVEPECFFAIGSPIGMFLTVRGVKNIGIDYKLPTCARFMNLFHPYDVVAYRIEPLIRPDLLLGDTLPTPVQLPHHKGRKRYHRQLQEHMGTVTAGLKTRLVDNIWSTLTSWPFGGGASAVVGKPQATEESTKSGPQLQSTGMGEALLNAAVKANTRLLSDAPAVMADPGIAQVVHATCGGGSSSSPSRDTAMSLNSVQNVPPPPAAVDASGGVTLGGPASAMAASVGTTLLPNDVAAASSTTPSDGGAAGSGAVDMGQLNEGNRVDYVLQESALESVNQYLFAFHAHTCYWDSEDTIFMILMELYGKDGFMPRQFPHAMAGGTHHLHHPHHQPQNFSTTMPSSAAGMHAPPAPPPTVTNGAFPPPTGMTSTSPFGLPPLHGSNQYPLLPGAAYVTGSLNTNRSPGPQQYPPGTSPPPPPPPMAMTTGGNTLRPTAVGPPLPPSMYAGGVAGAAPIMPPSMLPNSAFPPPPPTMNAWQPR